MTRADKAEQGRSAPALHASLARRAASGAFWNAVEMVGGQAATLAIFAIIAHYVTPSDFGLISVSYVAIFSLKAVSIDGLAFAVIRKREPQDSEYTTAFWLTLALSLLMAGGLAVLAPAAEWMLRAPGLSPIVRAMSVMLVFMGLSRTHELWLARHFRFRSLALRTLAGVLIGGIVGIVLAFEGWGVTALVIQQVVGGFTSLLLLWLSASWRPALQISGSCLVEIMAFMRTMFPITVLSVANQNFDTVFVAYFFGPSAAGLYGVAKRLRTALLSAVATPVNAVALPALAEVIGDAPRVRQTGQGVILAIGIIVIPVFAGSMLVANDIVGLLFGNKWSAAGSIFAVLVAAGPFIAFQSFFDAIFTAHNSQKLSLVCLIVYTLVAMVCFPICVFLGGTQVAVPFVLPYLVVFPLAAYWASSLLQISWREWRGALWLPVVATIAMCCGVLVTRRIDLANELSRVVAEVGSGALIYLAIFLIFAGALTSKAIRAAFDRSVRQSNLGRS